MAKLCTDEGLAWLDDAMTMELEASEEMLRSCRQHLQQEIDAKDAALVCLCGSVRGAKGRQ